MKITKKHILSFIVFGVIVTIILLLAYKFIAPFGTRITYQFNPDKNKDKASALTGAEPSANLTANATNSLIIPQQIIRSNIVTFNLKPLSKNIEGVWVNLRFKGNPKEIKVGVKGNTNAQYNYEPLYENTIEALGNVKYENGKLAFWQREKKFNSIANFLENPPLDKKTALYFLEPSDVSVLQSQNNSFGKESSVVINKLLRGTHSFLVKVNTNQLNISLEKLDQNMYQGQDILLIEVYKNNNKIFTKEIPDDGVDEASSLKLSPQKENIEIKSLEKGIYKINLIDKSNGDVSIKNIGINQSKVIFSSPVFIIDEKPTTLWTNSSKIDVETLHEIGLQTIKIDRSSELSVKERNKRYTFELNKDLDASKSALPIHSLEIPKNDVSVFGNGYFTFSKDAFFESNPLRSVNLTTIANVNEIDYILAHYQRVILDGEWKIAQAYFDPKDIKVDGEKLYFSLEFPGLTSSGNEVVIDSLEVTVNKPGWFNNSKIQNVFTKNIGKESNIITRFSSYIKNLFQKLFNFKLQLGKKEMVKPVLDSKPSPSPSSSSKLLPSPPSTPLPTTNPITFQESVRILNGGAKKGGATDVSSLLKENGFENVSVGNADRYDYQGITIQFRTKNVAAIEKIETALKQEYGVIEKTSVSSSSAEIVIIVGKK